MLAKSAVSLLEVPEVSEVAALLAPRLVLRSSLRPHVSAVSSCSMGSKLADKISGDSSEGELSASAAVSVATGAGVKAAGCDFSGLPRFTAPPLPVSQGKHCTDSSKARSARLHAGSLRMVRLLIRPVAVPARCSSVI